MEKMIFSCTECGGRFRTSTENAGKKLRCPKCKAIVFVPAGKASSATQQEAPAPVKKKAPVRQPPATKKSDATSVQSRRPERRPPPDDDDDDYEPRRRPRRSAEADERQKRPKRRPKSKGIGVIAIVVMVVVAIVAAGAAMWLLGVFGTGGRPEGPQVAQKGPGPNGPAPKQPRPKQPTPIIRTPNGKPVKAVALDQGAVHETGGIVKFDSIPIKVQANVVYEIEAKGRGWRPELRVSPGILAFDAADFRKKDVRRAYYSSDRAGTAKIAVLPEDDPKLPETLKYDLVIKTANFADKALLDVDGALSKEDPTDKSSKAHYDVHEVRMSAGQLYLINLTSKGKLSLGLRVEDSANKLLSTSRLPTERFMDERQLFRAEKDGVYRILATTFQAGATGPYHLKIQALTRLSNTSHSSGTVTFKKLRFPVNEGDLFTVRAEGEGWRPNLRMIPSNLNFHNIDDQNVAEGHFAWEGYQQVDLVLLPSPPRDGTWRPLKYSLKVERLKLDNKALLDVTDSLTAADPLYAERKTHYKQFKLKMSSDRLYVIDLMNADTGRVDTYLFLEDANGRVLKSDDDSGKGVDSRILFQPRRDGEYRIIASTLGERVTGKFRLLVRSQPRQRIAVAEDIPKKDFNSTVEFHSYPVKTRSGAVFTVRAEGEGWTPSIQVQPGFLNFDRSTFNERNAVNATFTSKDDDTYRVFVLPTSTLNGQKALKYKLKLAQVDFGKPILDVTGAWTQKDPLYRDRGTFYKEYKLKVKAGKLYLINLTEKGSKVDTYLFVEDAKKKILYADDDGGDRLNSRLFVQPDKDAEYSVIATTSAEKTTGGFLLQVQEQTKLLNEKEYSGELTAGIHPFKMRSGSLYVIEAEGDGWRPHLQISPGFLSFWQRSFTGASRDRVNAHYLARNDATHRLIVLPDVVRDWYRSQKQRELAETKKSLKYALQVTRVDFDEKPLLDVKGAFAPNDPTYRDRKSHYKEYKLKMSANSLYAIELTSQKLDSYLFLEDPSKQIVAQDDDGGGGTNSKLIFKPTKDGEYRIIATTLEQNRTGPFQLRVLIQAKDGGKAAKGVSALPNKADLANDNERRASSTDVAISLLSATAPMWIDLWNASLWSRQSRVAAATILQ